MHQNAEVHIALLRSLMPELVSVGAADALIVPTIPATLSERTLDQLTSFLSEHPPAPMILPFASMLDRRKRLQRDIVEHLMADIAARIWS